MYPLEVFKVGRQVADRIGEFGKEGGEVSECGGTFVGCWSREGRGRAGGRVGEGEGAEGRVRESAEGSGRSGGVGGGAREG